MRAGAHALNLLAVPLNVHVLEALEEGPKALVDLRRAVGSPPQTTMRGHLRSLTDAEIIDSQRRRQFPGPVDLELGAAGRDLLPVAAALRRWLAESPVESVKLGTVAAKSAIKALVDGWSSGMVRALAAKPLALTELSRLITDLSYPSLERRLGAMRLTGLVDPCRGAGRGTPYAVADWLRKAIGPLLAAARWERQHATGSAPPVRRIDVESAFLLALPLISLSDDQNGDCRMAVELRGGGGELRLAGVMARIGEGEVSSCVARLQGNADSWISGSASDWFAALIDDDRHGLEIGGDGDLAAGVLSGLHSELFGARQRA